MIRGLEEWRHYLEGASHLVVAWVDHDNLTYFRDPQCLNRQQAHWLMYVSRFELQIIHQSAKKEKLAHSIMFIPDTLSHGSRINTEDDNNDQIVLPKEMFINKLIIEDTYKRNWLRPQATQRLWTSTSSQFGKS
jgi:hypothetical protein